jgi:hypothetical protein
MGKIRRGRVLEYEDVMRLLRSEIKRAGGQMQWAKMVGMDRPLLNKMVHGTRSLNKRVIKALKLRVVFVPTSETGIGAVRATPRHIEQGPARRRAATKAGRPRRNDPFLRHP